MENAVWWFPGQSGLMGLNGLNIVSKQVSGSYPTRCLQYYPFDMCNCTLVCDTDWIRKKKYTFLRLFGRIFFKEFLAHNVLGHLAKLKRGLGLAFESHFLQDFSIKMFFNSLSVDKVSMPIVGPLLPQSPPCY